MASPSLVMAQAVFTPLGHLAPPTSTAGSRAIAVSGDGSTVVGITSSANTSLGSEAFRWRAETGMAGLGTLPGGSFSSAWGTSINGEYVVGYSATNRAFRWHESVMIDLGDLPGGSVSSWALEVTADGRVVYGFSYGQSGDEAFRWEDGEMKGLSAYPGMFPRTAEGLSGDESTVVGSGASGSGSEPYRFRGAFIENLGDLPGGLVQGYGSDASFDGSVVVGAGHSAGGAEAFRWTAPTSSVGLGMLPGYASSTAHAVTSDGWTVYGKSITPNLGGFIYDDAFVWDPVHGMRKLQDVLLKDYGLELPGWRLTVVNDCSDDGRVIVGDGINPEGFVEAWRLEMPAFCYADCDESSGLRELDLFDFLCFINRFASRDLYSDCDMDGGHDLFDYLCFINHFTQGCQ